MARPHYGWTQRGQYQQTPAFKKLHSSTVIFFKKYTFKCKRKLFKNNKILQNKGGGHFSAIERCKRKPKVSLLCAQGRGRNYDWIITSMMKIHTRYSLANKTKEPVLQNKSVAKVKSAFSSLMMCLMEFLVNLDLISMLI